MADPGNLIQGNKNMIKAKWITCPGYDPEMQCFFYAKKEWIVEKSDTPVFIRISADSRYRFYLNGTFVHSGPVRGSATLNFYDEIEISSYTSILPSFFKKKKDPDHSCSKMSNVPQTFSPQSQYS